MSGQAALAPIVDRLSISVHAGMRRRRDEVKRRLEVAGLRTAALVVDLRPFLLAGTATVELAREFARFVEPAGTEALLDDWRVSGALTDVDGMLVASPDTRTLLEWTTAQQASIVRELWADSADLRRLSETLEAVLEPVDRSELILFGALRDTPLGADGGAFRAHHLITTLRYLRSDLHVAEIRRRRIPLAAAKLFDALTSGVDPEPWLQHHVADLRTAGWVDRTASPTDAGFAARTSIDAAVDRALDAAFAAEPGSFDVVAEVLPGLPYLSFE